MQWGLFCLVCVCVFFFQQGAYTSGPTDALCSVPSSLVMFRGTTDYFPRSAIVMVAALATEMVFVKVCTDEERRSEKVRDACITGISRQSTMSYSNV